MSKSYTIKVNERYEFNIDEENLQQIDIIDKSANEFHLIEKQY